MYKKNFIKLFLFICSIFIFSYFISIKVIDHSIYGISNKTKQNYDKEENIKKKLDEGMNYIISPSNKVYLPIVNNVSTSNLKEQHNLLDKYAISYSLYGEAGKGNYDVFAHNSFYKDQYFTPFINDLKINDKVYIYSKEKNKYIEYEYKIIKKEIIKKTNIDKVYFKLKKGEKPIIKIGTCLHWYKTDKRIIWTGELENKKEKIFN